jgi:hypothetical protein
MSAALKLTGFAAVLAVAFAAAAVAGDAFGPEPEEAAAPMAHGHGGAPAATHADEHADHPVRGLAVAENGLRLVVETPELHRDRSERLHFRVIGEDGGTVRDFDVSHEKRMHLILARRDLTGFQHLHPVQDDDGAWVADVQLPDAGSYRLFADFAHEGEPFTLASDLRVDGAANLVDLPQPEALADAGDGYSVRLDHDPIGAAEPAELRFTVHKDGIAVPTEPYLGAGGHLVALREGDLAFLHVHPSSDSQDDSTGFEATFPTEGRYRVFLQFKHDGRVRTAAFTAEVG